MGLGGCSDRKPEEPPSLAGQLSVQLGQPRSEKDRTVFALTVENKSGRALEAVRATCSFFDVHERLLGTGSADWKSVAAGAQVSGEVAVPGLKYSQIDQFQCQGGSPAGH